MLKAYWKYLKYVVRHKWYVALECWKLGLWWAGISHDLSKFRPSEFHSYALFFYGKGQQSQKGDTITASGNPRLKEAMEKSWLYHVHRNKHHWNYWVVLDRKDEMQVFDMPNRYLLEMICDWQGCSKALRGKNAHAVEWYARQGETLILSPNTRTVIEKILSYKPNDLIARIEHGKV